MEEESKLGIYIKAIKMELAAGSKKKPGPIPKGRERTNILLHPQLKEGLRAKAKEQGKSMSDVLNELLKAYLE